MKLHANALPARILAYFASNPNEELTIEQVALKFGANMATVRNALARLAKQGAIESVRVNRLPAKGRMGHRAEEGHF